MSAMRRALIALFAVLLVAVAGTAAWMLTESSQSRNGKTTGEAAIGGPFTLVNGDGETMTEQDFRGRYMLIYFGYTFCPDVCPTSLMDLSRALDQLAEEAPQKAEAIVPVFISIDPERDPPQVVGDYVENFHPRMVGLTGSMEQVKAAADSYRIYFEKVQQEERGDAYLMDHSSYTYVMGPEGRYLDHFSHGTKPSTMAEHLAETIER